MDEFKPEVKTAYKGFKEAAGESLAATRERATEMTVKAAKVVDKSARQNTWKFIAAATLVSVFAGFLMGRKTRSA